MLKAIISSPANGAYGVQFEHQIYGRRTHEAMNVWIPCASLAHASAVAKAYNGVAFTETRMLTAGEPAGGKEGWTDTPLPDTAPKAPSRPTEGRELSHHGEPIACGLSRRPYVDHAAVLWRGSEMGVPDYTAPDVTPQDALHFGVRHVPINEQGYNDADGVHWGAGAKLWHARADGEGMGGVLVSRWFRAPSYAHAVTHIRTEFPRATTQRVA